MLTISSSERATRTVRPAAVIKVSFWSGSVSVEDWLRQHGFQVAIGTIPPEWLA